MEEIHPLELILADKHVKSLYTFETELNKVDYILLLRLFIRFMERSVHGQLIETDQISRQDSRYAAFVRIEIAAVTYYHSINQTTGSVREMIADAMSLGYTFEFSLSLASNEREVQLRIAFLDRYFYNLDHFIQVMNREFSFASPSNTKRKQQVFTEMLSHFQMETKHFTPKNIFDMLSQVSEVGELKFIEFLRNNSDRKIKYSDIFEYVANIRNSLHNNGFSNKSLNNLEIGRLKYTAIKDEYLTCLSLPHLLTLLIPLTKILEEIVIASVALKPQLLEDPYLKVVKKFVKDNS